MSFPVVRVASFLDPILKLCTNLSLKEFSSSRMIFFFIHDFPVLCIILAAALHIFIILEYLALNKKSHVKNSFSDTLWHSFVISALLLVVFLFCLFLLVDPKGDAKFQGVYSYNHMILFRSGGYFVALFGANFFILILSGYLYSKKIKKMNKKQPDSIDLGSARSNVISFR